MKTFSSLLVAFILISSASSSQTTKNDLVGAWRLISQVGTSSGTSFKNDSSTIYQTKYITPSRFVFTVYDPKNGSLLGSAQGPIVVGSNTYTETIEKASNKEMTGMTYKYKSTIKGNMWRIDGGGNGLELVEEWIRIE
jgi:hypothetical protein